MDGNEEGRHGKKNKKKKWVGEENGKWGGGRGRGEEIKEIREVMGRKKGRRGWKREEGGEEKLRWK